MIAAIILLTLFAETVFAAQNWKPLHVQPEQIHLSLGADPTQMYITWLTINETKPSSAWYGTEKMDHHTSGHSTKFTDGGSEHRHMYIHRVLLKNLTPGTKYVYHCGSDDGWSPIYTFTTIKMGNNWSPRFAVYGDLGNSNGQSIGRLQDDVERGMYDAILHVGDMAYDLHTDNARVGDEFMRQIEPLAAYLPYQVLPGNHEWAYNFSNYVSRFTMVNSGSGEMNNHFWSYNIGPAHIVAFSTEFYYFTQFGEYQMGNQYHWLEKDLIEANKPENRAQRPWIITMGHRPIYADNYIDEILRKGYHFKKTNRTEFGLEELFYKHGVDLEFWAHEHNYVRLWPIYDKKIYNGSLHEPYTNPKAPVHIVTGSAGNRERHSGLAKHPPDYDAFRVVDYGYSRLTIHNHTHLYLEQVSDDKNGEIIDKFYLIKEKHGPEAWL